MKVELMEKRAMQLVAIKKKKGNWKKIKLLMRGNYRPRLGIVPEGK